MKEMRQPERNAWPLAKKDMQTDFDNLDFERCEDEPIHIPESIQGYGYLFALDPKTGEVRIRSANIETFLVKTAAIMQGSFYDLLDDKVTSADFIINSYERAKREDVRLPLELKIKEEFLQDPTMDEYHAVVFASDEFLIIEIEPASIFKGKIAARQYSKIYSMNIAPKFRRMDSIEEMADAIANTVKQLTGFERVVIYRFNEDESGTVIAEAREDDIDSYMNLYYPASDIPAQARALYTKNWIRLTPNVDLPPVPLTPTVEQMDRNPLDLSQSLLRAKSPIHLQYIRNQGLKASMSISLVNHGNLWGLISCHHRKEHYLPQNIRLDCESLSQLFSWQLYAKEEELDTTKKLAIDETISRMVATLSENKSIVDVFKENEHEILNLMNACGFIFHSGSETVSLGRVPDGTMVKALMSTVTDSHADEPFSTENVDELFAGKGNSNGVAGALLIPLLAENRYYTAWFREEHVRVRRWAGNPHEKSPTASKRERMTPRTSFKIHEEHITNRSWPWSVKDLEIAERFNKLFLIHALRAQVNMHENIVDLQEKSQSKDEFLATLAHELRNPLSPIANAVTILRTTDNADHKTFAVDVIDRQLSQLVTLVDDLMDVSRITQGKVHLTMDRLDIEKVLDNAIEICETIIKEKGHELVVKRSSERCLVYADFIRLSQVFANILNNAAKYTDAGGRITISFDGDDKHVIVRIVDNGIGIPPSYIGRIFDMFSQVDASSTKTRGGLGIGLTLVNNLIRLHDGEISVRSDGLGLGSEFEVKLPVVDRRDVADDTESHSSAKDGSASKSVLIVDDNADVAGMLKLFLEMCGHHVVTASTGREAISVFAAESPEVAILDIGLPDIDGYELCQRLQELDKEGKAYFIAQSGWGQREHIEKSKKVGFAKHLVKPVDPEQIRKIVGGVDATD